MGLTRDWSVVDGTEEKHVINLCECVCEGVSVCEWRWGVQCCASVCVCVSERVSEGERGEIIPGFTELFCHMCK